MVFNISKFCTKPSRIDGEQSRERLFDAGLRLFAEQGFAKTSVRQIACEAKTNVAAVNYYFGDKAGLYRAIFKNPSQLMHQEFLQKNTAEMSLDEFLRTMFGNFLMFLKTDQTMHWHLRLMRREMIEPTGLWAEKIDNDIKPLQLALVMKLARHLNVIEPDDEILRLAIAIISLVVHLLVSYDVIEALNPQLIESEKSIDVWGERLYSYAQALIKSEEIRRAEQNI